MKATASKSSKKSTSKTKRNRDYSKVSFNGNKYGKGKVVLAVVQQYVKDHPNTTYTGLKKAFPDELHSLGFIKPLNAAKRASSAHRRYFLKQALKLKDRVVAVCSDFGKNNIQKFVKRANELGYKVRIPGVAAN